MLDLFKNDGQISIRLYIYNKGAMGVVRKL